MVTLDTRGGYTIYVDDEDARLLTDFKVHVFKPQNSKTHYVRLVDVDTLEYKGLLHNHVMNLIGVDHINGNGLDCRKYNLRRADGSENQRNRRHTRKEHKGVYFRKDRNYWEAKITIRDKVIYLGTFDTYEEALRARLAAELMHFGVFNGIGTQQTT